MKGSLGSRRAWLVIGLITAIGSIAALAVVFGRDADAEVKPVLRVGSKRFPESYILGEIVTQLAASTGEAIVSHEEGLGSTGIVAAALESGAIDVYAEYTGTIRREILRGESAGGDGADGGTDIASLDRDLARRGLAASVPLGFEDRYALAVRATVADRLALHAIEDLAHHPELRLGLSHEFLKRDDGWTALSRAYALPFAAPRGLEHGLAYEALASGDVDVIDVYTTDAKIERYPLRVLEDDRHFFPEYAAVLLHRRDLAERLPRTWAALERLRGRIDTRRMIAMNADAELRGQPFASIAARFLESDLAIGSGATVKPPRRFVSTLFGPDLGRLALEHLFLVLVSLAAGVAFGVPLGIVSARAPRAGQGILAAVGVIQTIPSLALFAFLIPLFHRIGTVPTLVALFLYSLLPIVRATHSGLVGISPSLRESAIALGLPPRVRLRLIELPLASRSILSGIKTAAVIDVGTATIAAFVGAGGFGERIASGLALNDGTLLLAGAIPAALLALAVQGVFEVAERWLVSDGIR